MGPVRNPESDTTLGREAESAGRPPERTVRSFPGRPRGAGPP